MRGRAAPQLPAFASGGLRDGIDIAKCVALGASLAGLANPFLRAADESAEAVDALIQELCAQLRIAMFCTASRDIESLRECGIAARRLISDQFANHRAAQQAAALAQTDAFIVHDHQTQRFQFAQRDSESVDEIAAEATLEISPRDAFAGQAQAHHDDFVKRFIDSLLLRFRHCRRQGERHGFAISIAQRGDITIGERAMTE